MKFKNKQCSNIPFIHYTFRDFFSDKELMDIENIDIYNAYVDEFATSMEMAGMSISLLKLDDELKNFLNIPANTPFFKQAELK